MKNVNLTLDNIDPKNNDKENSTYFDFEVNEFDSQSASIELVEEIDEKLIGFIEREIRQSYEYRKYIDYLKNELDLTKCSLLPNLDCKNGAASLEFHHFPMNLFEITEAVAHQMVETLEEGEKVSTLSIAEQVMEEHYKGNIGLVPLTKTLHEMAHNRAIIIPIDKVNGNYKKFLQTYNSYISEDIKDRIKDAENNSLTEDARNYNTAKLEKNISKFNIKYNEGDQDE